MLALAPIKPPKQSEPASPIKIDALFVLNIKKPRIAPTNNIVKVLTSSMFWRIIPVSPDKYKLFWRIDKIKKKKIK